MIPIPICLKSKQHCNSVCIDADCNQSPFICSHCQNHQCQHIHQHNGNQRIKKWTEVASLVQYYLKQKYSSQKILHSHDIKQQQSNQYIIRCLQNKQYSKIVGKSLSSLYNSLIKYSQTQKQEKYFQNRYEQKYQMVDSLDLQEFYFKEGQKMFKQEKYQNALELFQKVININKNNHEFYVYFKNITAELQKQEQFIFKYSQQINRDPRNSITYIKRGCLYYALNNYEDAIRDCDKAIQLDPKYYMAVLFRANAKRQLNQDQQAIKDYLVAILLDPNFYQAYYSRGLFYQKKKQWQLAIKDYTKVIEMNPIYCAAFNNRGIIFKQINKMQQALNDYNKIIDLDPLYYKAYYNRAVIHQETYKIELALEDYNKAIKLNPQYINAYYNRALLYQQKKQYDAALNDYHKIIQLNPKDWEAYNNRALIYEKKNELQKAINDMIKAMQLNQSSEYLLQIGIWYFKLPDYELSESHLLKYNQFYEQNDKCYYFLGRIELIKSNLLGSSEYLQKSIQVAQYMQIQQYLYKGIVSDLMQENDIANDDYQTAFQQNDNCLELLKNIYKQIRNYGDASSS